MLIHVIRTGNSFDYIKDYFLNNLIESKGIVQFRRKTGWVTIGTDPIRRNERDNLSNDTNRITSIDSSYVPEYRGDNR